MKNHKNIWRYIRDISLQFAIIALILEQFLFVFSATAKANNLPLNPDGSTNTQIDISANNIPIVNIATPNSAGLSHNKFNDYNVNNNGLILNNATANQNGVVLTAIGGLINDNKNLSNSTPASIILNEVTSNNISQINGYTEIAGKKADVILANPNGFVMNKAGFINVGRFTAVVGASTQNNLNSTNFSNDIEFNLSHNAVVNDNFLPKLVIEGAGVDVESVASSDFVANLMNIVAPIYGGNNDVNLYSGDKSFNYSSKIIASNNSGANNLESNPNPNFTNQAYNKIAIDASKLSKIQAGKIFILATKEGFGVKYSGDLLALRAGITIDSQGNIDYNNIASEFGDINITSRLGAVKQTGISQTKNSEGNINLQAFGDINNSGNFMSAGNINLETLKTFKNEYPAVNLSNKDFVIKALDVLNYGDITSRNDLNIKASTIKNFAKIIASKNLILEASQIANDNLIYAGNKINISANDYLTNNDEIISLGVALEQYEIGNGVVNNGIDIITKNLTNNKKIIANNDIKIMATTILNNNINSKINASNNLAIETVSLDNSGANIEANKNLTLRNLALSPSIIANNIFNNSEIINQGLKIINSDGTFRAGSLLDFNLGVDGSQSNLPTISPINLLLLDYAITGFLHSGGDMIIKANNITNQANLQAKNTIEIDARDKFVNGFLSNNTGDNSNIKIIAGAGLKITANNLLSNYSKLSAGGDLNLTSNFDNINNNINAEIIAGTRHEIEPQSGVWSNSGTLNFSAKKGVVNQNSLNSIVVNGDYNLEAIDFVNVGRVDIAKNLTLNISNNLVNEAYSMIYAGGNMDLNIVNDVINKKGGEIYAEGNLTIQKYATNNPLYNITDNRSNKVDNISAKITARLGDIYISSRNINNKREAYYTQNYSRWMDDLCANCQHENHWDIHELASYSGTTTNPSSIVAGRDINIGADSLLNDGSLMSANRDINVTAYAFNNYSRSYMSYSKFRDYWWHGQGDWNAVLNSLPPSNFSKIDLTSTFKAGRNINSIITSNISNQNVVKSATIEAISAGNFKLIDAVNVDNLVASGKVNIDLTPYLNNQENQGQENYGLFRKSKNPNAPLFETRSEFIDQSKFFGSNYFYQRIGLDLTALQNEFEQNSKRLVGDQFFQTKIIEEQIRTIFKNSFLLSSLSPLSKSFEELDINNEIKSLLNNATEEYARLQLKVNSALTEAQINALQKDIIWFETEVINGSNFVVPKIYLAKATRENIKNNDALATGATIYAGNDIKLTSDNGGIINQGSIIGNNINLASNNDVINKNFSNINALNDLNIISNSGNISNFSQISANNNLSLVATKNINNSATIATNDYNLLKTDNSAYIDNNLEVKNIGNIDSKLIETATISAGSLTIDAGNNFNNLASKINIAGNANIKAQGDINISSLSLRNRVENIYGSRKRGGYIIVDNLTNLGSSIDIGGDLSIVTTGLSLDRGADRSSDINISGSNITASGDIKLEARDNVNITSAVDNYYKRERINDSGISFKKSYETIEEVVKNTGSNLNSSGDINIYSGGDINMVASNLSSAGNGNILAGTYTDYNKNSLTFGKSLINDNANINILKAIDSKKFSTELIKVKTSFNLENAIMTAIMLGAIGTGFGGVGVAIGIGTGITMGGIDVKKTNKSGFNYDENIIASNLSFGKNLSISSMRDTTLQATKINANEDLNINSVNNLVIATSLEAHQNFENLNERGNYFFKNGQSGTFDIKVLNTEITSNANTNSNLNFNVGNAIIAQYNKDSGRDSVKISKIGLDNSSLYGDFSKNIALSYLEKLDPKITFYNPIASFSNSWDETNRGLTEAGKAVIAVTATALTMGAFGPINGSITKGALVAGTSATASTTAIAATNSSMNSDGDLAKQAKTIAKDSWDNITSKESVKNIIISTLAGGLAVGLSNFVGTGSFITPANASTISNSALTSERIFNNFKNSIQDVAINTLSSTASQSVVNGDSFIDSIRKQRQNILIYAVSKILANEIGRAYHETPTKLIDINGNQLTNLDGSVMISPQINKFTQLSLHAGLGAATAFFTKSDEMAGAIAGVVGEVVGESAYLSGGLNRKASIQIAGLSSGILSGIYGNLTGQSDKRNASNIWSGTRIGYNAAENNAMFRQRPLAPVNINLFKWLAKIDSKNLDEKNLEPMHEQLFFEDAQGGNLGYFDDSKVKPDNPKYLNSYKTTLTGFDDALMREAVNNASTKLKPYSMLGIGSCTGKFNCQDWAQTVRDEYSKLSQARILKGLETWESIINTP